MRVARDTNRYVDFCRNVPEVVQNLQRSQLIYMPFITLAELRAGFQCGQASHHNERVLARFLNSPRVRVLFADDQTTHHYARLLYARHPHFDVLPQIPRL